MVAPHDDTEPKTVHEALSSPTCNEWIRDVNDEMESIRTNRIWDLVDFPLRRKMIGNKWVLKVKRRVNNSIDRYKAHLVAKGNTQQYGIDYEETH